MIKKAFTFENNLYNLINNCGLPVETAYFILKTIMLNIEKQMLELNKEEEESNIEEEYLPIEQPTSGSDINLADENNDSEEE